MCDYWITNITFHLNIIFQIFISLTTTRTRIPNIIFSTYAMFHWILHSHWHLLLFQFWFELHFIASNLHLHLHEICLINVFASFIIVIMFYTFKFTSSVLFEICTLADGSSRALQFPASSITPIWANHKWIIMKFIWI